MNPLVELCTPAMTPEAICVDCNIVIDKRRAVKQLVKPVNQRRCRDCSEARENARQKAAREAREARLLEQGARYMCPTCGMKAYMYVVI